MSSVPDKNGGYNQAALDAASIELHAFFLREGSWYGTKACEEIGRMFMTAYLKAAPSAIETPPDVHKRYAAPFKMMGDKVEWVQVRFVSHQHIKDRPTEANPTPVRVIVVGDLERVQPRALGVGPTDGGGA